MELPEVKLPEERLKSVRAHLAAAGAYGFIVPYADAFQSRNRAAEGSNRLEWLTGFRGSAGTAVITHARAAVFVDSRYTLSARAQIDETLFEIVGDDAKITPAQWAAQALGADKKLGYDPFLHTKAEIEAMAKYVPLMPLSKNPVDAAWGDKGLERHCATAHDIQYAGRTTQDKISDICALIREGGFDAAAITRPDSVSWLLNMRVLTLPIVPVVHGYTLVDAKNNHVTLYTDVDCSAVVFGNNVTVRALSDVAAGIKDATKNNKNWMVDDFNTPSWFRENLEGQGAKITHAPDPTTWPKACKNDTEQQGIRDCHVTDGVALVKILHAIDTGKNLSERDIEKLIVNTREENPACFTRSFDPIVGFNENGAFVHGQVPEAQMKTVSGGNGLLLMDSGGQYLNGTTDVTRTCVIGTPSPEMKRAYTAVLRGHIALARAVFPEGTAGGQLDALARAPLWQMGYDYGHGTGHGVGYCLNVHEGPCNFSPKITRAAEPLKAGILMSVEPGVYLEGKFGIRHENLYLVVARGAGFLGLDAVTLAPFDVRGLDLDALRDDERLWLNTYHAHVLNMLEGHLAPVLQEWLTDMCAPV